MDFHEKSQFFRASGANLEQKIQGIVEKLEQNWSKPLGLTGEKRLYGLNKLGKFFLGGFPNKLPLNTIIVMH